MFIYLDYFLFNVQCNCFTTCFIAWNHPTQKCNHMQLVEIDKYTKMHVL